MASTTRRGSPSARWRTTPHAASYSLSDTRDQAAERAVQTWAALAEGRDIREVALIADAANAEIDRLDAPHNTYAHSAANSDTREIPLPRFGSAYAKATSSHSSHNTAREDSREDREAHARPGHQHP